jgi:hypothetical protein
MPTYNLGTATVSARVANLIKDSYERSEDNTLTGAQVLALIKKDIIRNLKQRVLNEAARKRNPGIVTEEAELNSEVTI